MNDLGDRMKNNYENPSRNFLTKRMPVIIRIDGKAFHTYTRNFDKPFDIKMMISMWQSARDVCRKIQGFKVAYVQSDEVSIFITDYDKLQTDGWFGYNKSKIESVSASMMTARFNHLMSSYTKELAYFDSRAFNIPREEVVNYFLWRVKDWERNSVSMYCRSFFSHKKMEGQGKADQHEMLHSIGKNWSIDCTDIEKNGTWISKYNVLNNKFNTYEDINNILYSNIYCDKEE